jgi:hypothetical protein
MIDRTAQLARRVGAALGVIAFVETPSAAPLVVDLTTSASAIRIDTDRSYDYLGAAVAVCDLSGDGTPDVLLGASGGDGP